MIWYFGAGFVVVVVQLNKADASIGVGGVL